MGLINAAKAISNRECYNSSVFEQHPSNVKFLMWQKLMTFAGSWKSLKEKFLFPILLCILFTLRDEISRDFQGW